LQALHRYEEMKRRNTDFAHVPGAGTALGPDPYVLRRIDGPGGPIFVGILRGRSAIVQLDGDLREVTRLPAPEAPDGLAVDDRGEIYAVGELTGRIARYAVLRGVLKSLGTFELPGVRAMRDIAAGPEGVLYVVEEHDGRLLTVKRDGAAPVVQESGSCHGPLHVLRVGSNLLVDCLLDHAIVIRSVDAGGMPIPGSERRIVHDGPMWGMDALEEEPTLVVAVGGVEDHPLDRTQGSFGFIDSFATVYRIDGASVTKVTDVNVSEMAIVTPKAVKLQKTGRGTIDLAVAGYGSDRMAVFHLDSGGRREGSSEPSALGGSASGVESFNVPPGLAMMQRLEDGSFAAADPLLDAWVRVRSDGNVDIVDVVDAPAVSRDPLSRMGEALFFTTLMAPWDRSDGRLSRFTCETCHFEGYVDGRVHRTGRGDIVATTKPLLGLFNNRPHFSRALDPDLTTMVNNEFRVAGAKSDHDPWFTLSVADHPLEKDLFGPRPFLDPVDLRKALMTFFMGFAPRPNPSVLGRSSWTQMEETGALVFRNRCESCHQARLVTDDASSRVPFERWQTLVMSRGGPIVWASSDYAKTGVTPYVHERGARIVSLRRLYKKYPYFTNGSGRSIASVLDQARFDGQRFFHQDAPPQASGLSASDKASLAAFLDLL
jgi:hypothetical protein